MSSKKMHILQYGRGKESQVGFKKLFYNFRVENCL